MLTSALVYLVWQPEVESQYKKWQLTSKYISSLVHLKNSDVKMAIYIRLATNVNSADKYLLTILLYLSSNQNRNKFYQCALGSIFEE